MNKLLIKGGRLFDPAGGLDKKGDVLVEGDTIAAVGKVDDPGKATVVDAKGLLVTPGFIDLHAHLRDPGRTDEECVATACAAAAHGGFTTILAMPNSDPVCDRASVVEYVLERAVEAGLCDVVPVGADTRDGAGETLAEMAEMLDAGALAFSNDGLADGCPGTLRRIVQYCKMLDVPYFRHCEERTLTAGGTMNESLQASRLGLAGMPALAEEMALRELIAVAAWEGGRVHAQHVSTAGSVEIIRRAKAEGVAVTAEACPHHLLFTEEALAGYDTTFKMAPPLRSEADRLALIAGLKDGTIDAIATDHAPHARHEKEVEFEDAAFGVTGLETCFPSLLTLLAGELGPETIVERLTAGPARVMGWQDVGGLAAGMAADVAVWDTDASITCEPDWFLSRSLNTPFLGRELRGAVRAVVSGGRLVVKDGTVLQGG